MHEHIFWIFALIALLGACFVISAKNPVHAVLSLIVTFLATAVSWLILEAEFLGITLILVYVGAVMVLFLFVVMMLDINYASANARFSRWFPIGIFLAAGLFTSIITIIKPTNISAAQNNILAYGAGQSNIQMLGNMLFTKYLLQFEIAGMILLTAIIAAIALIFRGPQRRKVQRISEQLKVNPASRITLKDAI